MKNELIQATAVVNAEHPCVSVIIPCYNYARYLEECIASIAEQTFKNYEIIIVNDGSTDNFHEVADKIKINNKSIKITIINQTNSGQPAISRNNGIKKAKGKYDNLSPEEYEKFLVQVKTWRRANNDKCRGYARAPKARASKNVRNRLKKFFKGAKDHHFSKGIGCTKKELTEHLQSQFVEGMSWGNYGSGENGDHVGSWHIDHIIPISKFKGEFPNHYTNLQPMWSIDNMRKGNKVDTPV